MTRIYGIRSCDTVRRARKWLRDRGIEHDYHDFRVDGLPTEALPSWVAAVGWEALLNRRGLAWRKLPPEEKNDVDAAKALELMRKDPTLIKRPVLEHGGDVRVGFSEAEYEETFGA